MRLSEAVWLRLCVVLWILFIIGCLLLSVRGHLHGIKLP
jgi:hypothetical protein